MRITGGSLLGRTVEVPPGVIRPAMDRMRESVFATLGDLSGLSFLDLFTGSGIIALEAASRGAAYIEAVEKDRGKAATLIANVALSPVRINCRFMAAELYVARAKRSFDLIFCDPPFPYAYKAELLANIAASPLMTDTTRLVVHHPSQENFDSLVLKMQNKKEYGRSVVDIFSRM